jgi:hypothetical protein
MIVVKPRGGLCNRMRVIKSLIALKAIKKDLKILVVWEKNTELYAPFNALFKPINNIRIISTTNFQTRIIYFICTKIFRFKFLSKNDLLKHFKRTSYVNDIYIYISEYNIRNRYRFFHAGIWRN